MIRKALIFILLLTTLTIKAQLTSEINRHVIIAFDEYPGTYGLSVPTSKIANCIDEELEKLDLGENDYISVVKFGIGTQDPSLSCYASTVNFAFGKWTWQSVEAFNKDKNNLISRALNSHDHKGAEFSMLTGAKYYSLSALFDSENDKFANSTYMLMITDNQYNGNGDMNAEFDHFSGLDYNFNTNLKRKDFINQCVKISQHYRFDYVRETTIAGAGKLQPYKAILFKVVPSSSFSLNSAVNFPANLGLHRVKGGYKLDFDYSLVDDDYSVKRLTVDILRNDGTTESAEYAADNGHVELKIDADAVAGDSLQVTIRGWLQKKDDIYNSVVMNPYDAADFGRLTYEQKLPKEGDAKILNIIPMSDAFWWWFADDLQKAVICWDVIIILIMIVIVCFIGYRIFNRITDYKPSNSNIKINRIKK